MVIEERGREVLLQHLPSHLPFLKKDRSIFEHQETQKVPFRGGKFANYRKKMYLRELFRRRRPLESTRVRLFLSTNLIKITNRYE